MANLVSPRRAIRTAGASPSVIAETPSRSPSSALPRVYSKVGIAASATLDLHVNDLAVFAFFKSRIWRDGVTSLGEMVAGVKKLVND